MNHVIYNSIWYIAIEDLEEKSLVLLRMFITITYFKHFLKKFEIEYGVDTKLLDLIMKFIH